MFQFSPPLGSVTHIHSHATLIFTLLGSLDDHITAQVWSNVSGEWRAIDFTDPLQENQPMAQPHLNLAPALPHQQLPAKLYQARFTPNLSPHSGSCGFTFRLYDKRDGSLCWLGDQHNNGRLIVEPCPDKCFACLDGAQTCAWRTARADAGASHEVARFATPHVAHGWAITIESKPLRLPLHLHDAPSGWALAESGDQVLHRTSLSPDETQFCFVALFSAGQDSSSLCFAGEALSLKASGDTPLSICAQGEVQHDHYSRGDLHVLQNSVSLAADGLVTLETDSEAFIAFYHPSTSTVYVLPVVAYPPALSVIHLRDFQAALTSVTETAWFCLRSVSSKEAVFHSEPSISLLVPSEGGAFTVSPATETVNGHLAAVLYPVGSSPVVQDVSAPAVTTVLLDGRLFSSATLFTLFCFILGTLFRMVERLGPVRRAAVLIEKCEQIVVRRVFHQSGSPLRTFTERLVNGHALSPSPTVTTPEGAASAAEETASFAIPVKQGEAVTASVLLAFKDPGRRSATRSNPGPATFFIGDQAVSVEKDAMTVHTELDQRPTSVHLPLLVHKQPTTTDILRIVF